MAQCATPAKQWHTKYGVKPFPFGLEIVRTSIPVVSNEATSKQRAMSAGGLKMIALIVWRMIMPSYLKSLYVRMPRRMKALVDAQSGHIKY